MLRKFTFLLGFLLMISTSLFGSDYFWVGGSGDWSDINHWVTTSGGATHHIQTPTASDNVIFDANSMSANAIVNLNSQTIFCNDFNVEAIAYNLKFIGVCQEWRIYGGVKLNSNFTASLATMFFEALSGTHIIKSNSKKIFVSIYFRGTATWSLSDKLDCVNIYLESGSLKTNSNSIEAGNFISSSSYSRSLDLGNSKFRVSSWNVSGSGYSVNAGNSKIFIKSAYNNFQHTNTSNLVYHNLTFLSHGYLNSTNMNTSFHKVKFHADGGLTGDNSFDTLIFSKGGVYSLAAGKTQTIIHAFVADGNCKDPIKISSSNGFGLFSKSSGAVNCTYLVLSHIHAGGGASFSDQGGIDLGDNTGWFIQLPPNRNLFWVGGDGIWADTVHWSLTSGGPGGACIPTIVDDINFDVNSFPDPQDIDNKVDMQHVGRCHDFNWENTLSGKLLHKDTLTIYGSCFFGKNLDLKQERIIDFRSNDLGETIETNNIELNDQELRFTGGGSWQLLDSLKNGLGVIIHLNGHLKTSGQYVHTNSFHSSDQKPKELSFGSSVLDIVEMVYIEQDSLTVHPNTSHFRMLGENSIFETLQANPAQLYNLTFVPVESQGNIKTKSTRFNRLSYYQDMILEGTASSDTIYYEKNHDYIFYSREDSILKKLIAVGTCDEPISFRDQWSLNNYYFRMAPTASVSVDYVNMRGNIIMGQGPYLATNSSDLGMNVNWTFSYNSVDHYWVGGQGNWQDKGHWSYSSGGPGGACIPMIYDDVFFNADSFGSLNDTVLVDSMNTYCRKMTWLNAVNEPVFVNESNYVSYISGSLELIPNMIFHNKGETYFVWDQNNKTIDMAGNQFDGNIIFCDTGSWLLLDTLIVAADIFHGRGKLLSNQYLIATHNYNAIGSYPKTLDIQNNEVHLMQSVFGMFLWNQDIQTYLLANNSHIIFKGSGRIMTQGFGQTQYDKVSFIDTLGKGDVDHDALVTNTFSRLFFQYDGDISGENTIDTLIFSKGGTYKFAAGYDQYIQHKWKADADCYGMITIIGKAPSNLSGNSNIHMLNGNVVLHSVSLKDIVGIGNGSFSINGGVDLGGNSSNWQITPTTARTLYWVNDGGDWFDTTHWSFNSGGAGGECIPTYKDDVFFDTASFSVFNDTAFSYLSIDCHNMIWQWTPDSPIMRFTDNINIYGSIALGDTMTAVFPKLLMHAVDTTNFIKTSGIIIQSISFLSAGGWHLLDSLTVAGNINHLRGSFRTMGKAVTASAYSSTYFTPRLLDIQNSNLRLSKHMTIQSDGYSLNSTNSTIIFDNYIGSFSLNIKGSKALHFDEVRFMPENKLNSLINNKTSVKQYFNKVTINNNAKIIGHNEFDTLIFRSGNTYELDFSKSQIVNDYWFLRGNNCYALNLQSTKKNSVANVISSAATVSGDFINMRDIAASGGAMFYAGSFSTDISNNSGWVFSNGPQYVYGLGPNVKFNLGGNVTLSTSNFNGGPNTTYVWSTGSTSSSINVNKTGWYFITVTYAGGCVVKDSIFVGCNLQMNYNITNNICNGDSLGIIYSIVPDTNYQYDYQWSTGDTLDFTDSLFAGQFIVLVSADSGLCAVIDTLMVTEPPPVFSPQGDTAFCVDDSVLLDLGSFVSFIWNDSYQGQYRWINQPDTFIIRVEDADGCWSVADTISIREDPRPIVDLGADTTICLNESVLLEVANGMDSYLWNTNSAMNSITAYYTGVYWVRISKKTCIVSDTIEIFNCPPKFIVPNVFTPNNDGYNDVFNIDYQNIWEFEVKIYDRWGAKVFQSSNLDKPWDGKINGREAAEGVYFWQIIYQEYNGQGEGSKDKMVRGTLSLYRSMKK